MLHLFAMLVAATTGILIFAGGLVTSTESGLSVPDWPNTYGYFMFFFPLEKMVGGIRYEHTHRLAASFVGVMTFGLSALLFKHRRRDRLLTGLGVTAALLVTAQALGCSASASYPKTRAARTWATCVVCWRSPIELQAVAELEPQRSHQAGRGPYRLPLEREQRGA